MYFRKAANFFEKHVDNLAQEALRAWATDSLRSGQTEMAAICLLALGEVYKAATTLANSNDQGLLSVAAELAKAAGQPTFATHIEDKKSLILSETPEPDAPEQLKPLPTKIDLLKDSVRILDEDCETEH